MSRSNGLKCVQAANQNDVFVAHHVGGPITIREGDYSIVCVELEVGELRWRIQPGTFGL